MRQKLRYASALVGIMMFFSMMAVYAAPSTEIDVPITKPFVMSISNVVYSQPEAFCYPTLPLRMDILQPLLKPGTEKPLPAVVFVPGGGFISTNKDKYLQQRVELAEAGYVVASIEYRVPPLAIMPAQIIDVKAAVRFLRANAKRYGIDPDHIAIWGESGGGYMVAMAGTTNGMKEFDKGENLDQSSDVQAVVDIYGLSDLTKIGVGHSKEINAMHASVSAPEALLVNGAALVSGPGGSVYDTPERTKANNPLTYIPKNDNIPPFLLMHGDHDPIVSPNQTEILHNALTEKGISSTRYVVRGGGHADIYWNQPAVMKVTIDFLDKILKP